MAGWIGDAVSAAVGALATGGVSAFGRARANRRDEHDELEVRLRSAENELAAVRAILNERKNP